MNKFAFPEFLRRMGRYISPSVRMASHTRSTKLPACLAEAAELRAKALGYPSWNAYIKGLIRYDLLVQGDHTITLPWAKCALDVQDQIDAKLLVLTEKGKGERGQLLKRIMKKVDVHAGHGVPASALEEDEER
jgi:hypothetical protein